MNRSAPGRATAPPQDGEPLAAIDLGSNSFHLQIGRVVDGQIYPLDAVREVARLGAGLTEDKRIDRATQAKALETLRKFAERLRGLPKQAVRAVGTNALRVAKNGWTPELRKQLFSWFGSTGPWLGGNQFRGFLDTMRKDALSPDPRSYYRPTPSVKTDTVNTARQGVQDRLTADTCE